MVLFDLLFVDAPIVYGGSLFGPCFVIQYFVSVLFRNNLDGEKRELAHLLNCLPDVL